MTDSYLNLKSKLLWQYLSTDVCISYHNKIQLSNVLYLLMTRDHVSVKFVLIFKY